MDKKTRHRMVRAVVLTMLEQTYEDYKAAPNKDGHFLKHLKAMLLFQWARSPERIDEDLPLDFSLSDIDQVAVMLHAKWAA